MVTVKIKADNYGQAIGLLLRRGGRFQTRFERTLIVNSEQRRILEEAGFVDTNGTQEMAEKDRGKKANKSSKPLVTSRRKKS